MRPQRFAADDEAQYKLTMQFAEASMRPQRFAADDVDPDAGCQDRPVASMRPQRFAADDISPRPSAGSPRRDEGFNEAAAFCCG